MNREYSDEITTKWVNDSLGPETVVEKKEKRERKEQTPKKKKEAKIEVNEEFSS